MKIALPNAPVSPTSVSGNVYCDLTPNATYDCAGPSELGICKSEYGFNFTALQIIAQNIDNSCHNNDSRIEYIPYAALTALAAVAIVGTNSSPKWYPSADVWNRLTTWKFPLLQLAAQFPRPPLPAPPFGIGIEAFVVFRLLGNPVATLQALIVKFASCEARALWWKEKFSTQYKFYGEWLTELGFQGSKIKHFRQFERNWKAFAMIVDSCDEWGRDTGWHTQTQLDKILQFFSLAEDRLNREVSNPSDTALMTTLEQLRKEMRDLRDDKVMRACLRTGDALAADRCTKLFPIGVAVVLFIAAIAIAFIRTRLAGPHSTTVFINIEAYSIAFSATYFWILSIVILGAAIGSSQTESAIRRILNRLGNEIKTFEGEALHLAERINGAHRDENALEWPSDPILKSISENYNREQSWERQKNGGVYSWQPNVWASFIPSDYGDTSVTSPGIPRSNIDLVKNEIMVRWEQFHTDPFYTKGWQKLSKLFRLFGPVVPGSFIFPLWVVCTCLFTAWSITLLVPPGDFKNCRIAGQTGTVGFWLLAWILDGKHIKIILQSCFNTSRSIFYYDLVKDCISTVCTFTWIIITQVGIFNCCDCFTSWGRHALVLPGTETNAAILYDRIQHLYPAIAFICIFYQLLVVPAQVAWQYFEAWQVLVQRDDGSSNLNWHQEVRATYVRLPEGHSDAWHSDNSPAFGAVGFWRWWQGWPWKKF